MAGNHHSKKDDLVKMPVVSHSLAVAKGVIKKLAWTTAWFG